MIAVFIQCYPIIYPIMKAVAFLLESFKFADLNLKFRFENYKYSFNLWRQKFIFMRKDNENV